MEQFRRPIASDQHDNFSNGYSGSGRDRDEGEGHSGSSMLLRDSDSLLSIDPMSRLTHCSPNTGSSQDTSNENAIKNLLVAEMSLVTKMKVTRANVDIQCDSGSQW